MFVQVFEHLTVHHVVSIAFGVNKPRFGGGSVGVSQVDGEDNILDNKTG